jgi:cytochrome c oxidase assembly factor 3, animal type
MSNQLEKTELKVKGLERKLKQSEIDFMKIIEEQNLQRVLKLKKTRKNNILTGKN